MQVSFVIFDQMTSLDFIGFYDPVTRLKSMNIIDDFEWRICSLADHVADDRGLRIDSDTVGEPLNSCDILFVPGGFGTRALHYDRRCVHWVKTAASATL